MCCAYGTSLNSRQKFFSTPSFWIFWIRPWTKTFSSLQGRSEGGAPGVTPPFVSLFLSKQPTTFRGENAMTIMFDTVWPPPLWKILATPLHCDTATNVQPIVYYKRGSGCALVMLLIGLAPNMWLRSSTGNSTRPVSGRHGFEPRQSVVFFSGLNFCNLCLWESSRHSLPMFAHN